MSWREERFNEAGEPRSYIRPHLKDGWVELLDSSHPHQKVYEHWDRKWCEAVLRGETNIQEVGRLMRELALTRRYMVQTEFGYVAVPDSRYWNNDLPERWQQFIGRRINE